MYNTYNTVDTITFPFKKKEEEEEKKKSFACSGTNNATLHNVSDIKLSFPVICSMSIQVVFLKS